MTGKPLTPQLTKSDHPVVIEMKHVTKIFGTRTVLDDISLKVMNGESLVIMGGTGCGKSTTLRIMSGILKPDGGEVICFGKSLNEMTDDELTEYRKRGIGILFQSGALFNSMSVYDNVALPLREHTNLEESTIDVVVKIKLELVGLRQHGDKMPAQLSGGMKKRAGLARAMALDPKVLFYDEPSAGLDPVTSAEIDDLIIGLNKRLGVTTVVVTHEMDSAFRVADRMVLLDRGKFVASGTPEEMKNSTDPLVHQFIFGLTEGPLTQRRREGNYEEDLLNTKSE